MARLSRIAILKPDHLGDIVLSIPAIESLGRAFPDVTLFCSPYSRGLAQYLFPGLRTESIVYPHLVKVAGEGASAPPELPRGYDLIVCLRNDRVIGPEMAARSETPLLITEFTHDAHETWLQKKLVSRITGDYGRTALFYRDKAPARTRDPRRVGLCVSAGFASNRWPNVSWFELGRKLARRKIEVYLIGGEKELSDLRLLRELLDLAPERLIVGSRDFGAFQDRIRTLDLVIASDSGTAHLCSLAAPVLSIFGPSPFRRYAPFGRHNHVLSMDLSCSPCAQFDRRWVNLCVSRECISTISPETVFRAVWAPSGEPGVDPETLAPALLSTGTSHLGRDPSAKNANRLSKPPVTGVAPVR